MGRASLRAGSHPERVYTDKCLHCCLVPSKGNKTDPANTRCNRREKTNGKVGRACVKDGGGDGLRCAEVGVLVALSELALSEVRASVHRAFLGLLSRTLVQRVVKQTWGDLCVV